MPKCIEKSVDLVGCYHSGTDEQTNEQGKIELLSQCNGPWTAKMSNCFIFIIEVFVLSWKRNFIPRWRNVWIFRIFFFAKQSYLWPKLQKLTRYSFENVVCRCRSPHNVNAAIQTQSFHENLEHQNYIPSQLCADTFRRNCVKIAVKSEFSFQVVTMISPKITPMSNISKLISKR